jgi:predicted metal-dependent hydrolase
MFSFFSDSISRHVTTRSLQRESGNRVELDGYSVAYHLQRSQRRSIGFLINDEGLRVTAPTWVSQAEIETAILRKQRWILSKLRARQERVRQPEPVPMVFQDGSVVQFLGQAVTLRIRYGAESYYDAALATITLNLAGDVSAERIKKHLLVWLMNQARRYFSQRLPLYAAQLGVQYHSFSLSNAATRWGSCNSLGKIRLNWRLIHFKPELIDYVIAHELAHLCEMNHSPRFWATVQRIYPNYAAARAELKQQNLSASGFIR